jgi:hypothetical protein
LLRLYADVAKADVAKTEANLPRGPGVLRIRQRLARLARNEQERQDTASVFATQTWAEGE